MSSAVCKQLRLLRRSPGARPAVMSAASIARVPEPHIGLTKGVVPSYPDASRTAAASVSRIGASCGILRYPRSESRTPLMLR